MLAESTDLEFNTLQMKLTQIAADVGKAIDCYARNPCISVTSLHSRNEVLMRKCSGPEPSKLGLVCKMSVELE
jgi:hypothetical protein